MLSEKTVLGRGCILYSPNQQKTKATPSSVCCMCVLHFSPVANVLIMSSCYFFFRSTTAPNLDDRTLLAQEEAELFSSYLPYLRKKDLCACRQTPVCYRLICN